MADKRIQDLPSASSVQLNDLLVLEQSGAAMNVSGQVLVRDLAAALDGHGGISNVSYASPVDPSLDGTLTITTADGTSYDVSLTNGRGITGLTWSSSGTPGDGLVRTGTIAYNDGTTSQVQIQDGYKGDRGYQTYVWFKWANVYPTQDSDMSNSVGPYIGIYSGLSSTAPTNYTDYTWYQYKGEKGDTGSNIQSIALTSTVGLVDTYTVTLTDGNTTNFTVTNAKSIVSIVMTSGSHAAGTTDIYTITFNDGDTAQFSVYNGANGLGSVSTVSGIQSDGSGDVPQVISGNGAPTTATIGQTNQLYYDTTNSILYYCVGESGGSYVWQGAGVTIDSALSMSSENPVQNKAITGRVGTGALPNSNTNLTSAINYVDGRIPAAASQTPLADTTNGAVGTGTNFARNDHCHPLNVATNGTPSGLGTPANGTSANYARQDHVHAMPSASDVGAVSTDDVQFKFYNSVTDLGLTSGSATIAGAFSAMPLHTILYAQGGEFASAERPSGFYGYILIVKGVNIHRSSIEAKGSIAALSDWRMFLDSNGVPTGTWLKKRFITYKDDTITLSANSNVSPFSTYGGKRFMPPSDYIAVSADVLDAGSTNPCVAVVQTNGQVYVYGRSAATVTVRVTFINS